MLLVGRFLHAHDHMLTIPDMSAKAASDMETPVTVSLSALQAGGQSSYRWMLRELTVAGTVPFSALEDAFGPDSLGIIVVKDLPDRLVDLRHRLLSYSSHLANLPEKELCMDKSPTCLNRLADLVTFRNGSAKLENPGAKWLVGWSCGREMLKKGIYDTQKGSYYVNCAFYKVGGLPRSCL